MKDNDSGALQEMLENMANYFSGDKPEVTEIAKAIQNVIGKYLKFDKVYNRAKCFQNK